MQNGRCEVHTIGIFAFLKKVTAIQRRRLVACIKPMVFHIFALHFFLLGALSGQLRHFGL